MEGLSFPRQYSQEETLTLAVSQLAENEQLLDAIAWRLGIPREEIRRYGREPPLVRGNGDVVGSEGDGIGGDGTEGARENGGECGSRRRTSYGDKDEEEMSENREQIEVNYMQRLSPVYIVVSTPPPKRYQVHLLHPLTHPTLSLAEATKWGR